MAEKLKTNKYTRCNEGRVGRAVDTCDKDCGGLSIMSIMSIRIKCMHQIDPNGKTDPGLAQIWRLTDVSRYLALCQSQASLGPVFRSNI
jgi:hypothetical protein